MIIPISPAGTTQNIALGSTAVYGLLALGFGIRGIVRTSRHNTTGRGLSIAAISMGGVGTLLLIFIAALRAAQMLNPTAMPSTPIGTIPRIYTPPANNSFSSIQAATPSVFDEFNFKFDPPPEPWIKMERVHSVNPAACLGFTRQFPPRFFLIIAERYGSQFSSDALTEIALNNIRAVAESVQVVDQQPATFNGVSGTRLYLHATVRGMHLSYAYWIIAFNGYFYQLIGSCAVGDDANFYIEMRDLWACFHLIDPQRQAESGGELLTSFNSPTLGVSMDLTGLGWRRSPNVAKELPSALFSGEHSRSTIFTLQACRLGDLDPPIEFIARAVCDLHQTSFDTVSSKLENSDGDLQTCSFEAEHSRNNVRLHDFYEILKRPFFAYILRGETSDPEQMQRLRALADHIHVGDGIAASDAADEDEFKKSSKLLLNDIGIQYENEKQVGRSIGYFVKAFDDSPDMTVLDNLIGADEIAQDYSDALVAVDRGLLLWPQESALSAQKASIEAHLGDNKGAAATFKSLFGSGYRDDNSFHDYILLLQKLNQLDDAVTAANIYLSNGDSETVAIDQALLYDLKGQNAYAIDLLKARWDHDRSNLRVGTNLGLVLLNGRQYDDAAKIAQQLIASGATDADTYLILGQAQFGLTWYRQAKETFEAGQQKSPDNLVLKKWIDLTSAKLGEGDNSDIQTPVAAVRIPASLLSDDPAHPLPAPDTSQDVYYSRRITAISFVPNDHLKISQYLRIKILTQHGAELFAKLDFPFESIGERVYLNKLQVRDEQGNVVSSGDVARCFVTDEDEGKSHSYHRLLNIPVDGLKPNETIECLTTREEISPPAQMLYKFEMLSAAYPVSLAAVYLSGDTNAVKCIQSTDLTPQPIDGGICWSLTPPPQYRQEPDQPHLEHYLSYVALSDKSATWEAIARNYLDSISSRMDPNDQVKALSAQLTAGLSGDDQKIAAILKYVQHDYTYTAIEFGRRALIPDTADQILHNKSGDCKDHALLLMQLLRAASIPANLALANFDNEIQPDLPSLDQFTHMIVCVPSMMPNGFYDCTNKLSDVRSGIPLGLATSQVLLLDPAHPRLVKIPDYPPEAFSIRGSRKISIFDTGIASVTEELSINGSEATDFRFFFDSISPNERTNQMQQVLASKGAIVDMRDLKIDNLEDASLPLILRLNYTMKNCFAKWSDQMIGSVPSLMVRYLLLPSPSDHRLTPFQYHYPIRLNYTDTLDLPAGYSLDGIPKTAAISDGYTSADIRFEQSGGSLTETLQVQSPPFEHPASDYNDFSQCRDKLIESLEPQMHLIKH